jgi:HlyD family secretion protein
VKRTVLIVLVGVIASAAILLLPRARSHPAANASEAQSSPGLASERRIAAPGVIEAASEEITVRAETAGRLTSVPVDEGDHVSRGEIVATVDRSLAHAQLKAAEAEAELRRSELTALLKGANGLQRLQAWVGYKEAETGVEQARAELDRRKKLFDQGALPEEEVERAANALTLAEQRQEEAGLRRRMMGAAPLDTDREHATAALRAAEANVDEARSLLAKTIVRAPISGVVVHRYLHAGELASEASGPILTIADTSHLRVRAEIDEADVGLLHLGEPAYATAPAYGDRKFSGHVIRIAGELGRKTVTSGDPAERMDTKVLETLIDLDPGASLPLGLRVTCFITPRQ